MAPISKSDLGSYGIKPPLIPYKPCPSVAEGQGMAINKMQNETVSLFYS